MMELPTTIELPTLGHEADPLSLPQLRALVVVPTYNEADNITRLVGLILAQPGHLDVLVVDDNSPDGTGQVADALANSAQACGRVHVLHRPGKSGLGRAYLAGFAWALERGYEAAIEMDADFSHDPIYLPGLLRGAASADLVIGSRYLNGISVINWPLRRVLLSWGANDYVRRITGLAVRDCTSGFRLYRRAVLEGIDLPSVRSNGYSFQVEMTFRAQAAGFRVVEVPIIFVERHAGQSKMSKSVIWESVLVPWKLRLRARSLRRRLRKSVGQVRGAADASEV